MTNPSMPSARTLSPDRYAAALLAATVILTVLSLTSGGAPRAAAGLLLVLALPPLCVHYVIGRVRRLGALTLAVIYSLAGVGTLILVGCVLSLPFLKISRGSVTGMVAVLCVLAIAVAVGIRRVEPEETEPDELGPDELGPDELGPDELGPAAGARLSWPGPARAGLVLAAAVVLLAGLLISIASERSALSSGRFTTLTAVAAGSAASPTARIEVINHEKRAVEYVLRVRATTEALPVDQSRTFTLQPGASFRQTLALPSALGSAITLYKAPDLVHAYRSASVSVPS